MLHLLVIGAKLQGVEAIYLARQAGYHVTVLDHNPQAPGLGLADAAVVADVYDKATLTRLFRQADVVLPALEDTQALARLLEYQAETGTLLIFDQAAYAISSSKHKSNQLFIENDLPIPELYPACDYPLILKPDGQSGSQHVYKAACPADLAAYLARHGRAGIVIQEYLEGRSFSLEVLGDGETFIMPQITEIICDSVYDCKRVIAPAQLSAAEEEQMLAIGHSLAASLKIKGIFDIEVISQRGRLKLLEIDARLPSQTPVSIYHASGMNLVDMLVKLALGQKDAISLVPASQFCAYQQVQVAGGQIRVLGERIMGNCKNLQIHADFFGSTAAITDYTPGSLAWKAIVITTGPSRQEAEQQFIDFVDQVKQELAIKDWLLIEG